MPQKITPTKTTRKTFNADPQYRNADVSNVDTVNRTFDISFSSETPFERWYGKEILDHAPDSVRMERLISGKAPLLLNHRADQLIGIVEKASLNGKRGTATVRLSKNADAILTDIEDGIISNISVGYRVYSAVLEEENRDGPDTYRVTDWEPLEISVVSVPADATVGIGRTSGNDSNPFIIEETRAGDDGAPCINANEELRTMPAPVQHTPENPAASGDDTNRAGVPAGVSSGAPAGAAVVSSEERKTLIEQERTRAAEITALGKRYHASDLAERSIAEGMSADAFRRQLLDNMPDAKPINIEQRGADIGLSGKEKQQYSFLRALHAAASGDLSLAPFEREVSDAARQADNRRDYLGSFTIPQEILDHRRGMERRGMSVNDYSAGGALVGTMHDNANFIDVLRSRMLLPKLGVNMMNGLVGDVAVPKQTGGATGHWVNENQDVTESEVATGSITLKPRTVGAHSKLSRKLLLQSSPDAENLVRNDMAATLARLIESAAYNGTGAGGEPMGILNTTGRNQVDYGTAITWADVVAMETEISADDADLGNLAYICTTALRGAMKTTPKESGQATYIWDKDQVNGYQAHASNLLPAEKMIFGNFNDLIIASWSGLDVLVDPYTKAQSGQVCITAFHDVDVAVRHPESFCEAYT